MDEDQRKHTIFMETELRQVRSEIAACSWTLIVIAALLVLILWRIW